MDVDEEDEEERAGAGLKWGLGTMFQDGVDWLSASRRRDYRVWEREVRDRIERIDKEVLAAHS